MALMAQDASSVSSLEPRFGRRPSDRSTLGTFNASLDAACRHWVASGERGSNFRCLPVNVAAYSPVCQFRTIRSDALRRDPTWLARFAVRVYRALAPIGIHERGLGLSITPSASNADEQSIGLAGWHSDYAEFALKLNSVAEVEGVQMIAGLPTERKVAYVDHLRWDLKHVFDKWL